jgi:hypothetical protein
MPLGLEEFQEFFADLGGFHGKRRGAGKVGF